MNEARNTSDNVDFPVFLWRDEFETNHEALLRHIQLISDFLIFSGYNIYSDSRNSSLLYSAYHGDVSKDPIFHELDNIYGEKGAATIQDFGFFHPYTEYLKGLLLQLPFKLSIHSSSQSATQKKINRGKDIATGMLAKLIASQSGMDFLASEHQSIPTDIEEVIRKIQSPLEEEVLILKLLSNIRYKHSLDDMMKDCYEDRMIVNAEAAYWDVVNGVPYPKYLRPDAVSWISSGPIKTLNDADAIDVREHISFSKVVEEYGYKIIEGSGVKGIKDTLNSLRSTNDSFSYDPRVLWVNGESRYFNPDLYGDNVNSVAWANIANFYKPISGRGHQNYSVLRQKCFFKMIKPIKLLVKFNGANPTPEQWDKYVKFKDDAAFGVEYKVVDKSYAQSSEERIQYGAKTELWKFTRIGHNIITDLGKYPYTPRKVEDITKAGYPIVLNINPNRSIINLGYEIWIMHSTAYTRIKELVNIWGADSAIMIDSAQLNGADSSILLHSAKKAGVVIYDSTKVQSKDNPMAQKHLTEVKLSSSAESITKLLGLINVLEQSYGRMVGMPESRIGNAGQYAGFNQTQTAIQNSSYITQGLFYSHNKFMSDFMQTGADILKWLYAKDGEQLPVLIGKSEVEILKLTKDLSLHDYDVMIDAGMSAFQKNQTMDSMVEKALSSGAVDFEKAISMIFAESPEEKMKLFSEGISELRKERKAAQEQAMQVEQQNSQVEQMKASVPIEVAKISAQATIEAAKIRSSQANQREVDKGVMMDIQNENQQYLEMIQGMEKEENPSSD